MNKPIEYSNEFVNSLYEQIMDLKGEIAALRSRMESKDYAISVLEQLNKPKQPIHKSAFGSFVNSEEFKEVNLIK